MTVTWLARSRRSGPPGTGEACQRGMAVGRAAKAWAAEMLLGDGDGDGDGEDDARSAPCRVWLGGDWRGVAELHDHLTRELGLPASVVRTRDDYRLG